MVYYYEIVSKPLTSKILPDEVCPVCSKKDCVQVTLYMKYISALIPIFGMGRSTSAHCVLCNHVIKQPLSSLADKLRKKEAYSQAIADACTELRHTYKRTAWQLIYPWSLCFVLFGLILFGLGAKTIREFNANKQAKILANPQPGDIYKSEWDEGANRHSKGALVKVVRISGDTLVIVRSKDMIDGIDLYSQKGWNKISTNNAAFDPEEYKVQLSSFLKDAHFEEFNTKRQVPFGYVMGLGRSNYDFEVVERK